MEKSSQLKKELFPNCRGKKKMKCTKSPNCANKKAQHSREKKDTLLNTIKGTKPENASLVTGTALRLTS